MAEIVLDRSRVLAIVGELVAARMAQHMAVNEERKACSLASASNHALIAGHAKRCQALGNKHIGAGFRLTLEPSQGCT